MQIQSALGGCTYIQKGASRQSNSAGPSADSIQVSALAYQLMSSAERNERIKHSKRQHHTWAQASFVLCSNVHAESTESKGEPQYMVTIYHKVHAHTHALVLSREFF